MHEEAREATESGASGWEVIRSAGSAADFHQRMPADDSGPEVWIHTVERPALILGSTQPDGLIRRAVAEADGIEVCRRRSGGGLVWVDPRTDCWVDVIVPTGSRLWDRDIGRAFHWLGDHWSNVLGDFEGLTVHRKSVRTSAGRLWCFAEMGHGEVAIDGRKIVGLSQRRTRNWARLQCLVLGRWPGAELAPYINVEPLIEKYPELADERQSLRPERVRAGFASAEAAPDPANLADRFVAILPRP